MPRGNASWQAVSGQPSAFSSLFLLKAVASRVAVAELTDNVRGVDEYLVPDGEDRYSPLSREPDDLLAHVCVGVDYLVVEPQPLQLHLYASAERAVVARV